MKTEQLISLLYNKSPYQDFPIKDYQPKVEGWHSDHPMFSQLIEDVQPSLMIEVGTWLGGSALTCAEILKKKKMATPVICIDTWLGAQEFWKDITHNPRYTDLDIRHGYPSVFHQFIANVIFKECQDWIVPLPQTSQIAARILAQHNIQADLIYIDGSHDEGDVMNDLEGYWPLLRKGGIMFGDDFDEYWPGLILDVERFREKHNLELIKKDCYWIMKKTRDVEVDRSDMPDLSNTSELAAIRAQNAILHSRLLSLQSISNNALRIKEDTIKALFKELEAAYTKAGNLETTAGFFAWERDQLKAKLEELEAGNNPST
jgi:predicted O-methyltransferase YrrM